MDFKIVINNNIKYYREKANITEEDLSLRLGKNKKFISNLEKGMYKIYPNISLLEEIAKVLNIPIEELVKER